MCIDQPIFDRERESPLRITDGVFVPGGVALAGQIGVGVGLALLLVISVANLHKEGAK